MYDMSTVDGPSIVYASGDSGEAVEVFDPPSLDIPWETTTDNVIVAGNYAVEPVYFDFGGETDAAAETAPTILDPIEGIIDLDDFTSPSEEYVNTGTWDSDDEVGVPWVEEPEKNWWDFEIDLPEMNWDIGWDDVYNIASPWSVWGAEAASGERLGSDVASPEDLLDPTGAGGTMTMNLVTQLLPLMIVLPMVSDMVGIRR